MELFEGITVLEGREACIRTLRDPELRSATDDGSASVLLMDGPDHARVREVLREIISGLEPLPPAVCAEISRSVTSLGRRFDLVADFARPVAGTVTSAVLGVPIDDVFLGHLAATTANLDVWSGATDKAGQASAFRLAVQLSRDSPEAGGGLATLRAAREAGRITEDELLLNPVVLAHAAYENSLNFLAVAGLALAEDAALAARFRAGEAGLVRELARRICPARFVLRSGPDGPLAISLADGLPFGLGRHACPGSGVALAEADIALRALADVLTPGCTVTDVARTSHPVFHGLTRATVTRHDG